MGGEWLWTLQCQIADASAGRREFPVVFLLDRIATPDEAHDAFRAAREVDQRVVAVEHRVDHSQQSPRSEFTVQIGVLDPHPPPFLEQHPRPLLTS